MVESELVDLDGTGVEKSVCENGSIRRGGKSQNGRGVVEFALVECESVESEVEEPAVEWWSGGRVQNERQSQQSRDGFRMQEDKPGRAEKWTGLRRSISLGFADS